MKHNSPLLPDKPELPDKTEFPLYRHLLPRKSYKAWMMIFCAGLVLVLLAACGILVWVTAVGGSLDGNDGFLSAMPMLVVMSAALFLLCGGVMAALYRSEMRKYAKRWAIMNMLSTKELIALQDEITKAPLWFGTFYLLEHYLYAPKQKVIIHYGDIAAWKQTIQSGIHLEITEQDGTLWQVHIEQWRAFLQEQTEFMETFRSNVVRCGGTL